MWKKILCMVTPEKNSTLDPAKQRMNIRSIQWSTVRKKDAAAGRPTASCVQAISIIIKQQCMASPAILTSDAE
jgi:hypothetical protein